MTFQTGALAAIGLGLALVAACAGGPSSSTATEGEGATEAGSTSTSTGGTDGMSSTSVGSTSASTGGTSTTTTSSTTDISTGGESTGGCAFLCPPDGGDPWGDDCDVWAQDCPEGLKCMPWANDGGWSWNAHKCTPIDPDPDAVGEACSVEENGVSGVDSCVLGAMCWNVDPETNTGVCIGFCQGNEESCSADPGSCCPGISSCTISAGGILILCLSSCDPILQDCAGVGEVCYPVGNSFQCAPDVSGEMGAVGDPCEYINVCDPGTFCGYPAAYPGCDLMAGGCCIPFCELDSPACAAGTECEPWYDPMDVPPGYEDLGACVIPS